MGDVSRHSVRCLFANTTSGGSRRLPILTLNLTQLMYNDADLTLVLNGAAGRLVSNHRRAASPHAGRVDP